MSIRDLLEDIGRFVGDSSCQCYALEEEDAPCPNCVQRNETADRVESSLKDIIKETLKEISH